VVPNEALSCRNVHCCCEMHGFQLKNYSKDIMDACVNAAWDSIPQTSCKVMSGQNNRIPGWNAYVAPARNESLSK